jgi:hypothetical protein
VALEGWHYGFLTGRGLACWEVHPKPKGLYPHFIEYGFGEEVAMLTKFGKSNPDFGRVRSHGDTAAVLKFAASAATTLLVAVSFTL